MQPYVLEHLVGMTDKLELLDYAISLDHGEAVLEATLFLQVPAPLWAPAAHEEALTRRPTVRERRPLARTAHTAVVTLHRRHSGPPERHRPTGRYPPRPGKGERPVLSVAVYRDYERRAGGRMGWTGVAAHLRRRFEFDEMSRVLSAVGRVHDDGMLKWWLAHRIRDVRVTPPPPPGGGPGRIPQARG